MDCILQAKTLCKHNRTGHIYEVTRIDYIAKQVITIGTKIKKDGIADEIIDRAFSFDDVEIMIPTGKMDSMKREILEHDIILYGEKLEFKGKVEFDDDKLCFCIFPVSKDGGKYNLSEIISQYIHIISDRMENYERNDINQ